MNGERKRLIAEALAAKMAQKEMSQKKASRAIGFSDALLSQMLNGVNNPDLWAQISNEKWLLAEKWAGVTAWQLCQTRNVRRVFAICNDAKANHKALAVSDEPGCGKSASLRWYADVNPAVYYVECEEYWTKKVFLQKIVTAMGGNTEGSISELVDTVIDGLLSDSSPLLILDEADKLKDNVLSLFKTFYNKTDNRAGFVLCGAPYFQQRVIKGCNRDKQAYKEIRSRLGGEFIKMVPLQKKELEDICLLNGVPAENVGEVLDRLGKATDLRVVKRVIEVYLIELAQALKPAA